MLTGILRAERHNNLGRFDSRCCVRMEPTGRDLWWCTGHV